MLADRQRRFDELGCATFDVAAAGAGIGVFGQAARMDSQSAANRPIAALQRATRDAVLQITFRLDLK